MSFTRKTTCRACGGEKLAKFLDLGDQPMANAFLSPAQFKDEKKYPLDVFFCESCAFVQLGVVVDPKELFGEYLYVSSTSPVFVKHFDDFAGSVVPRFGLEGELAVDIGSNDGILLRPLKSRGVRVLGIDPAENIATQATKSGIETLPRFFNESVGKEVADKYDKAKLMTATNVFAHIDDLDSVMEGVKNLLKDDGVFVIEAPYLAVFLEKKLFDTVYHEHLSYLAVEPLIGFFEKHGMKIFDVQDVSSHGGSMRVFVERENGPYAVEPSVPEHVRLEKERGLQSFAVYEKFAEEVEENKRELVSLLENLKSDGKKIAGYGAPAKGNTLLHYMGIDSKILDYIVDDSPPKQGLFTPGTHIPVVSSAKLSEAPPDYLFILAWNFAESIMKKCEAFEQSGGKFIVPVPKPKVV
jgi:SAM-dependent methyltransferase